MSRRVGDRVYAVCGAVPGTKILEVFGSGTYVGREVPHGAGGFLAEALVESGQTNPKLVLDNGDVVWGCECWWSDHDPVTQRIESDRKEGWEIRTIRIEDARRRAKGEEASSE